MLPITFPYFLIDHHLHIHYVLSFIIRRTHRRTHTSMPFEWIAHMAGNGVDIYCIYSILQPGRWHRCSHIFVMPPWKVLQHISSQQNNDVVKIYNIYIYPLAIILQYRSNRAIRTRTIVTSMWLFVYSRNCIVSLFKQQCTIIMSKTNPPISSGSLLKAYTSIHDGGYFNDINLILPSYKLSWRAKDIPV